MNKRQIEGGTDMSDTHTDFSKHNMLLKKSIRQPLLIMLYLYFIAWIIKIFDTFIFRLDELIGEAILTKALGVLLTSSICGW